MIGHSDHELWSRIRAGDAEAFAELFTRHAKPVYNYLFRRTGSWTTAEDLTSIATNVVRNQRRAELRYRKAFKRLPAPLDELDFAEEVTERLADEETMKDILAAFRLLPPHEQDAAALCLFGELSYEEAALTLGVPVGTVRSRLSRARVRLRERLAGSGHNPVTGPEQASPES